MCGVKTNVVTARGNPWQRHPGLPNAWTSGWAGRRKHL